MRKSRPKCARGLTTTCRIQDYIASGKSSYRSTVAVLDQIRSEIHTQYKKNTQLKELL